MKLLFIHQNFPGQYIHLALHMHKQGHEVVGLGEADNIRKRGALSGITTIGYPSPKGPGDHTHHYLKSTEAAVRRGQAVARSLLRLRNKGFVPDVICVHPGWGEALFVRDVYPRVPVVQLCEYYFQAGNGDLGFDPEFPESDDRSFSIRVANAPQALSLLDATALVSPTRWQASRYPKLVRETIRIIPDGVDTGYMCPEPGDQLRLRAPAGQGIVHGDEWEVIADAASGSRPCLTLTTADTVFTYVSRNLEPYRGFHRLMRAVPEMQRRYPQAHILVVGGTGTSYSKPLPPGENYKRTYLKELDGALDMSRIHFLGLVPYSVLRTVYRISTAHLYFTYPFVLSWSLLEAMACEARIVASATEPVREVITHGRNGLLVDFFDQDALLRAIDRLLDAPVELAELGPLARQTIVENFELRACLRKQEALLEELGKTPA